MLTNIDIKDPDQKEFSSSKAIPITLTFARYAVPAEPVFKHFEIASCSKFHQ